MAEVTDPLYYPRALRRAAQVAGIQPDDLKSETRLRHVVHARWSLWLNLHRRGSSNTSIARRACRDQSTVCYGLEQAKHLEQRDMDFAEAVQIVGRA